MSSHSLIHLGGHSATHCQTSVTSVKADCGRIKAEPIEETQVKMESAPLKIPDIPMKQEDETMDKTKSARPSQAVQASTRPAPSRNLVASCMFTIVTTLSNKY